MFTYSQVEGALARAHGITEETLGAFRGRIKHFQRLGIVPASPGKGKKIAYEIEDVWIWAFCLEMAQFGTDPAVIKEMVTLFRNEIIELFRDADKKGVDMFLAFQPNFMLSSERPKIAPVPAIGVSAQQLDYAFGRRVALFNVTTIKTAIDAALSLATLVRPTEAEQRTTLRLD